jgi:hypothetical protein
MQYLYTFCETREGSLVKFDTATSFHSIDDADVTFPFSVIVSNLAKDTPDVTLKSIEDLVMWRERLEREFAWAPNMIEKPTSVNTELNASFVKTDAIQLNHYQNFIDEYQWIDAMSRISRYQNPELFIAAVELQIRKYLDRNGRKDSETQELSKGLFYYIYMMLYIKNNKKPIHAKYAHEIMDQINSVYPSVK